jgi:hypothetical protein
MSPFFSVINTKTVTKLVLLGEILAISILHTIKSTQESKPTTREVTIVSNLQKKLGTENAVSVNKQNFRFRN